MTAQAQPALIVRDLRVELVDQGAPVVADIALDLVPGQILGLVGDPAAARPRWPMRCWAMPAGARASPRGRCWSTGRTFWRWARRSDAPRAGG
jgi:ABC-type microcin C transport system duplicated ATPase subunit YejF